MKFLSIILAIILLSSCAFTMKREMPDVPDDMLVKPKQLQEIQYDRNEIGVAEILEVIVKNYEICHENETMLLAWHEWYEEQKRVLEGNNGNK